MATKAFDGHICAETMDLIVKRQIVIRDESGKPVRYHPLHQLLLIPIKSKRVHAIIVHDCKAPDVPEREGFCRESRGLLIVW